MENFFLFMIVSAGILIAILLVMGARVLMRRGEIEQGGLEFRGAGRRTWAVALTTIAEGLRMRLAMAFVVVIVVALPTFALIATGDGTIKGRVQMFIGYSFGFATFVLAMLTIVLSARSLSGEIAGKQIFGMVSKPIPRWQIVVGKWMGVTLLNVVMIGFALIATYGGIRYIIWTEHSLLRHELETRGGLTADQAAKCVAAIDQARGPGEHGAGSPVVWAMADALGWTADAVVDVLLTLPEETRLNLRRLDEMRRQVLVARASLVPPVPDVSEMVQARFLERKAAGELDDRLTDEGWIDLFTKSARAAQRRIAAGVVKEWTITGGPPPEKDADDFLVSVRYKLEGYAPARTIQDIKFPEDTLCGGWILGPVDSPNSGYWPEPDPRTGLPEPKPLNAVVEFELPARVIADDGTLKISLGNMDPRGAEVLMADGMPEVLYTASSFEMNLLRAAIAAMLPLMMLTSVGVLFSTFCTFAVAALVTVTLYCAGATTAFLYESVGVSPDTYAEYPSFVDRLRKDTAEIVLEALRLGRISPTDRLVEGRLVAWSEISRDFAINVALKGGLALLLATYVFRRRELAAIIV